MISPRGLGAADQAIDDATRILEIQRKWRKLIGLQTETYGVYRACYESPDPKLRFIFLSPSATSAEKSDSWQSYAALRCRAVRSSIPESGVGRPVADNLTEKWMTEEPAKATNDDVDLEIEAVRSVYTALKGLDAPAQNRVLDAEAVVIETRNRHGQPGSATAGGSYCRGGSTANAAPQPKAKRPPRQP